jgi:hypothetical protein
LVYEAESGTRRFLLKAVRESGGELFAQFSHLNESELRWRPAEGEWCLKEIAGHLRDAERLYARQLELIASRREPRLPCEPIEVFPAENGYREMPLNRLLQEYAEAREDTFWILRMLDDDDWQRAGIHPYRGRITVADIVRDMHEHDLEYLYRAQRLRKSMPRLR